MVAASREQQVSVNHAIRSGSTVAGRFIGMTDADVDAHFDNQRRELDRLTMLSLVASAEATIRVDYHRRVHGRLKDGLAKAYRNWHERLSNTKRARPNFDGDGILDVLRESNVMDNNIIGQYRDCLRVRHWVGHGRYWARPAEVDRLDPDDVFDRAYALLRALPN